MVGSSHSDQLRPLLSNGPTPYPYPFRPASDYLCVKINFQKSPPLRFLNVHSLPIRNTQLDSRPRTFSPELLPNSSDTFILSDFNAHHSTWDISISLDNAGNFLFNWISSSQLDILATRLIASHMLRHHGEHPQSSPGPNPRPGRPLATTSLPAQTPVLFSTSLTQLLARRVLPANFLTLNPTKTLPKPTLSTSAHTSSTNSPALSWC